VIILIFQQKLILKVISLIIYEGPMIGSHSICSQK